MIIIILNYQNDEDYRTDKAKDEVVVGAEPAVLIGAIAERIDDAGNGDDQQRYAIAPEVVPAQSRFFRLEHLDQQHVQLKTCLHNCEFAVRL